MKKEELNEVANNVGTGLASAQRGITLISLIITIIILLILAGVTINLTIGENGLFGLAENAGKNYIDAQEKEENMLAQAENHIYSSRQVSQKEYDELKKERDYLKEELQKSKKIIYLGQGNSFNLKQLQENGKIPSDVDLTTLNVDNFIVGITSIPGGQTANDQVDHWSTGYLYGNSVSKSYNISTTILSVVNNTISFKVRSAWSGGSSEKSATVTCITFAYLVY